MNRNTPVIIEDRKMPEDDFYRENSRRAGFTDIVFLGAMISTMILWITIIFICK